MQSRDLRPRRHAGSHFILGKAVCKIVLASVADGAHRGVGVLVIQLVAEAGRDVDDLCCPGGRGLGRRGANRHCRAAFSMA